MAEEPLVHQLPLPGLLLPAQRLRLGRDVGRHDGQHAVLHVLQHRAPQLRGQRLDEGHRVHGSIRAGGLGQLPALLLRPLLRQHLKGGVNTQVRPRPLKPLPPPGPPTTPSWSNPTLKLKSSRHEGVKSGNRQQATPPPAKPRPFEEAPPQQATGPAHPPLAPLAPPPP